MQEEREAGEDDDGVAAGKGSASSAEKEKNKKPACPVEFLYRLREERDLPTRHTRTRGHRQLLFVRQSPRARRRHVLEPWCLIDRCLGRLALLAGLRKMSVE